MEYRRSSPQRHRHSQTGSRQDRHSRRNSGERRPQDDDRWSDIHNRSDNNQDRRREEYNRSARLHDGMHWGRNINDGGQESNRLRRTRRPSPRTPTLSPPRAKAPSETSAKKPRLASPGRISPREESYASGTRKDVAYLNGKCSETQVRSRHERTSSETERQPRPQQPPFLRQTIQPIDHDDLRRKLNDEPTHLLLELSTDGSPIKQRLTDDRLDESRPEIIATLLCVVHRALQCTGYPQHARNLCRFLSSCELFTNVVYNALVGRKLGSLTGGEKEAVKTWTTIAVYLQIAEHVLAATPDVWKAVRQVLLELTAQMSDWRLAGWEEKPEDKELLQRVNDAVARARDGRTDKDLQDEVGFRKLSILPTIEDLKTRQPILRPNLPKGAFDDCEHYLDVQFRLLREDFMAPLRTGVSEYLEKMRQEQPVGRLKDVRVYQRIVIDKEVSTLHGITYLLRFPSKNMRISEKLLMDGSLVCLSADNFQTFFVATVQRLPDAPGNLPHVVAQLNRRAAKNPREDQLVDPEDQQSFLDVQEDESSFEESNDKPGAMQYLPVRFEGTSAADIMVTDYRNTEFVMVQTTAYFENYRHILESLKELNRQNLKFQPYLIQCSCDCRVPPAYLKEISDVYNLECIVPHLTPFTSVTRKRFHSVSILSDASWPSAYDLGLDESQLAAFKLALTSELAIIQGPPGTGKTFIGLKIARAILSKIFSPTNVAQKVDGTSKNTVFRKSPLLVMCNTNHALDQFLEGLYHHGSKIVRIGGGSKSELLKARNIIRLRGRDEIAGAYNKVEERSSIVNNLLSELHSLERSIASFDCLKDVINPSHAEQIAPSPEEGAYLEEDELSDDQLLLSWLGSDNVTTGDNGRDSQQQAKWLRRVISSPVLTAQEEELIKDVRTLKLCKRWQLYSTWISRYRERLKNKISIATEQQAEAVREKEELTAFADINVLRRSEVIGLTTTGAAKYRKLLQEIRPKVIIVEEAAQVLEGHVVTKLGAGCEHLILIGDHQQLRPSVNVDELAKMYHLDVSLFERMVTNQMAFCTLTTQHRMRLEISSVMREFYENLKDDESVKHRKSIKGLKYNMFYVSHSEPEHEDEDETSHYNEHEATFLVALTCYLLKQGFRPNQITILTTYSGQVRLLQQLTKKRKFEGVIITTVDNYQGEENDLILLSTVRSNKNRDVGFTWVPNRICVMLSRARLGLFAIGNFEMLRKCKMWNKILVCVEKVGMLGRKLPLMCEKHKHVTHVQNALDFDRVPEGGCDSPCDTRLQCGHTCNKTCHDDSDNHVTIQCSKPCLRNCKSCGHPCDKLCYEDCYPCPFPVTRKLSCGHEKNVPCGWSHTISHMALASYLNTSVLPFTSHLLEEPLLKLSQEALPKGSAFCEEPCQRLLACGHNCLERCGDACATTCLVEVKRTYSCGHMNQLLCHQDENTAPCKEPCTAELACSHSCRGTCGSCAQGRLHKPCSEVCGRLLVCGHKCTGKCCNSCPPCREKCENRCVHSKCGKTCGEPCVQCREPCAWSCEHYQCKLMCFEPCIRPPCSQPCEKIVRCGRCRRESACIGVCGEPCPKVCDHCHPERPYREIFFGEEAENDSRFLQLQDCKHVIESKGMDNWIKRQFFGTSEGGDQQEDSNAGGSSSAQESVLSIQALCCPMCKTPVRRCIRYGLFVNERQIDIELVKAKIAENARSTYVAKIRRFKQECLQKIGHLDAEQSFSTDLMKVRRFVISLRGVLRNQEVNDARTELNRIGFGVQILAAQREYGKAPDAPSEHGVILRRASELVVTCVGPLSEETKACLQSYKPIIDKYAPISQAEKEMIIKAMDFGQKGHWYKCPKGHIYCIGECGGAMEVGTCPDCKCAIGGTSHRLQDDNSLASEMDGASRPAYSELNLPDLAMVV